MKRVVAFRTDASLTIGSGHVMRCLTLAHALSKRGYTCVFVSRELEGHLAERVRREGFEVHRLPAGSTSASENATAHGDWLEAGWREDAEQTRHALRYCRALMLVVDHYALDKRWEHAVRRPGLVMGVIDDLADRPHECDWLLDQNLGCRPESYRGRLPARCICLTGPDYALLRPEFRRWRDSSLARRKALPRPRKLLISLGGVDRNNITGRLLSVLAGEGLSARLELDVILGSASPWVETVDAQLTAMSGSHSLSVNVNNMAERLAGADLCIGAAGGSAWERCCLGLPAVTVIMAENQRPVAEALYRSGCSAGYLDITGGSINPQALTTLLSRTTDRYPELSQASASLVDGLGVDRVADCIEELAVVDE